MPITDWPADTRPRERLMAQGADALSDAELLAIVLRSGRRGRSAVALAHDLIGRFGSLQGLVASGSRSFCDAPGVGFASWASLQAAVEISRRTLREELHRGDALQSPAAVRSFLTLWLRDRPHEAFVGLFLDCRNRLLAADELFRGTLTQTAVYPREIVRRAIELNAGAVVFAHNHPSGVAEPSHADRALTEALRRALEPLEVRVLDHLIVAGNRVLSFAEQGLV